MRVNKKKKKNSLKKEEDKIINSEKTEVRKLSSHDAMKAESSEKPKNKTKSKSSSEALIVVSHY